MPLRYQWSASLDEMHSGVRHNTSRDMMAAPTALWERLSRSTAGGKTEWLT